MHNIKRVTACRSRIRDERPPAATADRERQTRHASWPSQYSSCSWSGRRAPLTPPVAKLLCVNTAVNCRTACRRRTAALCSSGAIVSCGKGIHGTQEAVLLECSEEFVRALLRESGGWLIGAVSWGPVCVIPTAVAGACANNRRRHVSFVDFQAVDSLS